VSAAPVGPVAGEVRALVDAARAEQRSWGALTHAERGAHLVRVRRGLARRAHEIAAMTARETGKPLTDALYEVLASCAMLSYVAHAAPKALREQRVRTWPVVAKRAHIRYAPLGVIGVISPWNYPVGIPFQVLPFALAAGNTVVFKPSELTPGTGALLAEVINDAGRPLVQLAAGDGRVGEALIHAGIDKLAFTGSTGTARRILAAAAEELLPTVVELGGKDAMIVCEDADIDEAARAAVGAAFSNAGQTCMASERALVVDERYQEFVDRVVDLTRGLHVGSGAGDNVGSMTRGSQIGIVEDRLADAVARGARVVVGGHRSPAGEKFFEPTVVLDAPLDSPIIVEENFAPVLCIVRVDDEDAAVELANASDYGLNGSVFTSDRARAERVLARLEVGGVNVNDAMVGAAVPALPFGGTKQSGFGRLQGAEGLREFSRATSVVEPVSMRMPSLAGLMFTARRPSPRLLERVIRLLYGR
jgi:succinate-semialdehyde dehydrogenase / glutarate-semialdehyde dehydrogenase